jgi:hypothetical protein
LRQITRKSESVNIWPWRDGEYKVHCQHADDYERIIRWKGTRPGGVYSTPSGNEFDVIIPGDLLARAKSILTESRSRRDSDFPANPTLNDNDLRGSKSTLTGDF